MCAVDSQVKEANAVKGVFMLTEIVWVAGGMILFSSVISSWLIDRGDSVVIQ